MKCQADTIAANELKLYGTNDGQTYAQSTSPVIQALAKKIAANTYEPGLALKAWQYVADYAAQRYTKEYGSHGPNGSFGSFDKATRVAAASLFASYYNEQLREAGAEITAERKNRKRWTLSAVKAANEAAGHFFFSRDTMRFFGDTMASFKVVCEGFDVCLERVKADKEGCGLGKRYTFHPETGHINAHERG